MADPAPVHTRRDLFLISFLILFLELTCIRWFGSHVVFLTFFTNAVLMACFLGMSIGCLSAGRKPDFVPNILRIMSLAMIAAWLLLALYSGSDLLMVDVGNQGSPQQVYFGTEYGSKELSLFWVPIEAIAGVFFLMIALCFVGLGQILGRSFDAIPSRVGAYSINILGSIAGIVAFSIASFLETGPHLWFLVCTLIVLYFDRPWGFPQMVGQIAVMFLAALTTYGAREPGKIYWSPYYKVSYVPQKGSIATNYISHQSMKHIQTAGPGYALPHLLNRDLREAPFHDVLIIGAGSGNDVQAALAYGAEYVDAVEIDPVLQRIGSEDHPDRPYDDPRVHVHLDDGRSFLRNTRRKYDLVIYALVDSLVLHTSYSSVRLESFLFTKEAFSDIRGVLKPRGVFAMYNFYRMGWVVGRLKEMTKEVFGTEPLVMTMPHMEKVSPSDQQTGCITFVLSGGVEATVVRRLRESFDQGRSFWLASAPSANREIDGFALTAPSEQPGIRWHRISPAQVDSAGIGPLPTDDWPFLYLREPRIPSLNWRGMGIIAGLSILLLLRLAPLRNAQPNFQMFFLGAGFMLLETKAVVHMALLFGSTWIVNSIVFFTILVMILLANLLVLAVRPQGVRPYYVGLLASLALGMAIPMHSFLALPGIWKILASCAVVFVPVAFAGIVFAVRFRDSVRPDVDLGYNIAGVILGGLSEYFSLMIGFNGLLGIAIAYYILSALPRTVGVAAATQPPAS